VQATPYTQIAIHQKADRSFASSASAASVSPSRRMNRRETLDGWGVYDDEATADPAAEARRRATEQRRHNEQTLRSANRPIWIQTQHGGRFVAAGNAILNGASVKRTPAGIGEEYETDSAAAEEERQQLLLGSMLSTGEQLRAALEGRSIQKLRQERLEKSIRARSAGGGAVAVLQGTHGARTPQSLRYASGANPMVSLETTGGQVLSGRFSNAMALPLPQSFDL
jgi:hypothetical protein